MEEDEVRRARRLTTWHYQWMILHEFLPLFVGPELVDDILTNGRKFYTPPSLKFPWSSRARRTVSAIPWYDPLTERTLLASAVSLSSE